MNLIKHKNTFQGHAINGGITNERSHSETECCKKDHSIHVKRCHITPSIVNNVVQAARQSSNDTMKQEVKLATEKPESEIVNQKLQRSETQSKEETSKTKVNGHLQGRGNQNEDNLTREKTYQDYSGMINNSGKTKTEKLIIQTPTEDPELWSTYSDVVFDGFKACETSRLNNISFSVGDDMPLTKRNENDVQGVHSNEKECSISSHSLKQTPTFLVTSVENRVNLNKECAQREDTQTNDTTESFTNRSTCKKLCTLKSAFVTNESSFLLGKKVSNSRNPNAHGLHYQAFQTYMRIRVMEETTFKKTTASHNKISSDCLKNFAFQLGEKYQRIIMETPAEHHIRRIQFRYVAQQIYRHWQKFQDRHRVHTKILRSIALEAVKECDSIKEKIRLLQLQEQQERLNYLKEHDLDKYWEHIQQSKTARISETISRMKIFIDNINHKMKIQQEKTSFAEQEQRCLSKQYQKSCMKSDNELDCKENPHFFNTKFLTLQSVTKQPSILSGGKLLPYQLAGLNFMINLYDNGLSGILADEMGLGKTIQTIAFLAYLKEHRQCFGPHIVIAPLSTLPNWINEFARWCPCLDILEFRGNKQERRMLGHKLKRQTFHVCVTTYDWVLREKSILSAPYWSLLIVDEGHRLKNIRSKFHVTLTEFRSTHRVLLTGTPLQNNLSELWSLLNFLLPNIFSSSLDFEMWFEKPYKDSYLVDNSNAEQTFVLSEEEKFLIINTLHSVLRPFLLRRVKEDVLDELPHKKEYNVRIALSFWQKRAYEHISSRAIRFDCKKKTGKSFSNIMMQLRKVVNHPYLFEEEYNIDENIYRLSGKFEVLDRIIPKLIHFKHKTLLFCQMTHVMDILDDYFEWKGYSRCRLDGTTVIEDRRSRMEEFNDPNTSTLIFTLSTRAGGLGLNLQAADTVILFDSDWNPHQDLQAQARAHRYGQKNEVFVFRFITTSNIEEAVLLKAQHKLDLDEKIIKAGMFDNKYTDVERQKKLREFFYPKCGGTESSITTPQELNRILARNDEEFEYFEAYDKNLFGEELFEKFKKLDRNKHVKCLQKSQKTHLSDKVSTTLQKVQLKEKIGSPHNDISQLDDDCDVKNFQAELREAVDDLEVKTKSNTFQLANKSVGGKKRRKRVSEIEKLTGRITANNNLTDCQMKETLVSTLREKGNLTFENFADTKNYEGTLNSESSCNKDTNELHTEMYPIETCEALLMEASRLIRPEDTVFDWVAPSADSNNIQGNLNKHDSEHSQSFRQKRQHVYREFSNMFSNINIETLSEAAFNRALRSVESRQAPDFETAIALEKTRVGRRCERLLNARRLMLLRRLKRTSDFSEKISKNASDLSQDDLKNISEVPQDDLINTSDLSQLNLKNTSDLPQDDLINTSDISQPNLKNTLDLPHEDIKNILDLP